MAGCFRNPKNYKKVLMKDDTETEDNVLLLGDKLAHDKALSKTEKKLAKREGKEASKKESKDLKKQQKEKKAEKRQKQ